MKRWLCLALAGVGVCLLLALGHPDAVRGADQRIACWGRSVGPWEEPASASPTAASAPRNSRPPQARAGPPESLAVHLMLSTEREVSPPCPWLDTRGPPGRGRETSVHRRAPGQTGSPKATEGPTLPPRNPCTPTRHHAQEGGFATAFSYNSYTVTDLGTLGGTFSQAGGLNNRGSVAGFSTPPGDQNVHAFLWQNGVMTDPRHTRRAGQLYV